MRKTTATKDRNDSKGALKHELRSAREEVYRARIVEAAEAVFAEAGYERARIKDIAERAGLSVGSVYGVFDGKDALFETVHEERSQVIFEATAELLATEGSPLQTVLEGVGVTVRFFCAHPNYLRMHLRDRTAWALSQQSTPVQSASWEQGLEMLSAVFAAGIEAGELWEGDPRSHARMVMAMHQVKLAEWIATEPLRPVEDVVDELSALVRRAFEKTPQATKK